MCVQKVALKVECRKRRVVQHHYLNVVVAGRGDGQGKGEAHVIDMDGT